MSIEIPQEYHMNCIMAESVDNLKRLIFDVENKLICIPIEKIINTSSFAPPMPNNVEVRVINDIEGDTITYLIRCSSKLECYDSTVHLVYDAYAKGYIGLIVFLDCPEMRINTISMYTVNDDGEVIDVGEFNI